MSSREKIMGRVRAATEALPDRAKLPRPSDVEALRSRLVPDVGDEASICAAFAQRWRDASGVLIEDAAGLAAFLEGEGLSCGYADPEAMRLLGGVALPGAEAVYDRARVDVLQYGVTRATAAIAETGTIVLSDADTPNRLAALAPWVHVAVVRKSEVVASLQDGVMRFTNDPSIVFVTGPSKTADIEGILIEGVHGPGRQAVVLV